MRKRAKLAILGAAVIALATLGGALPAGAGGPSFLVIVEKEVVGDLPPGAQFVVDFECVDNGGLMHFGSLTFDGPGTGDSSFFGGDAEQPIVCTVIESDDGGATSVTYACEDDGGLTSQCQADNVVLFEEEGDGGSFEGTITVTNTFEPGPPPPPSPPAPPANTPAEPVAAAPAFTG